MKQNFQRVLIKGGVLSPSELMQILEMAENVGLENIHLGSRQDILFPLTEKKTHLKTHFPNINLEYVNDRTFQNIVSSYDSADILPSNSWVKASTYLNILELFRYGPKLEINITDPFQQLVPLFSGQINFIASEQEDYWYLYLRLPNWENQQMYPVLLYTWDLGKIAQVIEELYQEVADVSELFEEISKEIDTNNRNMDGPLYLPTNVFPYYEGMNKMSLDHYWLGLYWRNNCYDIRFLKEMCKLCLENKIGKICLTPWKSIIIKRIPAKFKLDWEKLLGTFGINVRHSSLELNWHLPVADEEALELKRYIVRNFDQNDISTYGLTFSVKSDYGVNFSSIVIEKNPDPSLVKDFQLRPSYNILYCEDFNPNKQNYITYAQDVDRVELPGLLMELSQLYFAQLGQAKEENKQETEVFVEDSVQIDTYQCADCFTIYDSRYGDSAQQIEAGIPFEQLAADYKCPLCEAEKSTFIKTKQMT
ncbi:MAG: rubredoxin [Bacteroidota bacterium]